MRVDSINAAYATSVRARGIKKVKETSAPETGKPNGIAYISFRGGNKSQAIMVGVEIPPYNKAGGVATVMQDFRALRINDTDPIVTDAMKNSFDFYKQNNKVLVDPFYNGFKTYQENGIVQSIEVPKIPTGLPADSPYKKYEGQYFQTNSKNLNKYTSVEEFLKKEKPTVGHINPKNGVKGNLFILKPVTEKQTFDFGGLGDSETRLFRVQLEDGGQLKSTNDFKVFTDLTASLESPYAKGGYSTVPGHMNQTWKGVPDAKAMKAIVNYMPTICEEVSKDGVKFDPATVILNDSQTGYATEYMAEKVTEGNEFWKGKKGIFVGHNLGDGYVQRTGYMNMFMNIADKELRNAIYNDKDFILAAKEGDEDKLKAYFKNLLPKECLDKQEEVSPFKTTIYWTDKGLVSKLIPVSENYAESLATDPEFAPGVYEYLKNLKERGVYEGILNAFENVDFDPTSNSGPEGYMRKTYNIDVNGKAVKIEPLSLFQADKIKEGAVDVNHVREIKRQNKVKILQRFDEDVLEALTNLKEVEGQEKTFSEAVLGLGDKEAEVHGYIRKDIIEEAKKANSKVKLISGWGRSDVQKAMDSAMNAFVEYVKNNPQDKYSVLMIGGPNSDETQKCIDIIKQYSKDKDIAGRMVFIDGFLPNKPFASASDFTVFPSRFAPCELTDLESSKMFASPIVTNLQGLAQKNFDASFPGEADKVTGYKTQHAYTIHVDELKKLLNEKDNKALDKAIKKFRKGIKDGIHGKEVTDEMIDQMLLNNSKLNWDYNFKVLRPFRDKLIENELTGLYKRALIEDNGKPVQNNMLQNLRKMKTDWEHNNGLKKDGISSAEKYRKAFRTDPKEIKKEDTLLYKLRENCKGILEKYRNGNNGTATGNDEGPKTKVSFFGKIKKFIGSKGGKWTLGIAGGAAVLSGLGYAGYKAGWLDPKFAEEKKPGNLSQVA